jgi:hypothetical protein
MLEKASAGDCPAMERVLEPTNKLDAIVAILLTKSWVWVVKEIVTVLPWFVGTLSASATFTLMF